MENADCYGILVSEEIFLALRPRNFSFDPRPLKVSGELMAYVFEDCYPVGEDEAETRSVTLPIEQISPEAQLEVGEQFLLCLEGYVFWDLQFFLVEIFKTLFRFLAECHQLSVVAHAGRKIELLVRSSDIFPKVTKPFFST